MSKHSSKGRRWEKIKQVVFNTHGHYCVYCGQWAIAVDHKHPKSDVTYWEHTGLDPDDPSNLVPACTSCNSIKGNKTKKRVNYYNPAHLSAI